MKLDISLRILFTGIFILFFILLLTSTSKCDVVYITKNKYVADYVVYVTHNKSEADIIVEVTEDKYKAKGNKKFWYFTNNKYSKDYSIYLTNNKYISTLKIYFYER